MSETKEESKTAQQVIGELMADMALNMNPHSFIPCQHLKIEPQLVCERCGHREALPDPDLTAVIALVEAARRTLTDKLTCMPIEVDEQLTEATMKVENWLKEVQR